MDLKSVKDEFDRILETQELSMSNYQQLIDNVEDEIKQAITALQSADDTSIDHKSVIELLRDKLDVYSLQEQLEMSKKDLKVDVSNYSEILGKLVETDISKAYINMEFDSHIVNQIILNLLYHEGLFDVADIFVNEAQEPDIIPLRSQFSEMHQILDELKAKNLEPALNWVLVNRQRLYQSTGPWLEFFLRRLQFLDLLELEVNQLQALNFAKTYLSPLLANLNNRYPFFNLMGCLLWAGKLETSPYSNLLPPNELEIVSHKFMVEFCGTMGMSFKNPLAVTVDAGAQALPTFLEDAKLAEKWPEMKDDLPVTVDLGREFQYHSVFVCPVSKTQCDNEDDHPVLLPCTHVVGSRVVLERSENYTKLFECPICRLANVWVGYCQRLYF
ncbi:hypothetical protein L1887_04371 [Cichorium endivia]|nr:hypothetical protein L1887_04371 [Cichorium endivia]